MEIVVGIDVGKFVIDLCVRQVENNKFYRFENTEMGHKNILELMSHLNAGLVVCEPTGGYERALCLALIKANYKVHRVNSYSFSQFSKSISLSKTDRQDAARLAYYGQVMKPAGNFEAQQTEDQLRAYQSHREDCVLMLSQIKQRLDRTDEKIVLESMKRQINFLKEEIDKIDKLCLDIIEKTPSLQKRVDILVSIPGIGNCLATKIVAYLPELGGKDYTVNELSSITGVAPYARDSGMKQGKRFIRGGRKIPRDALYMAVLSGRKKINHIQAIYERIIAQGKAKKVAIVAAMRKLLALAHSLIKHEKTFQSTP